MIISFVAIPATVITPEEHQASKLSTDSITSGGLGGNAAKLLAASSAFSPPFFFATEEGKVFFADDLGHSAEVIGGTLWARAAGGHTPLSFASR